MAGISLILPPQSRAIMVTPSRWLGTAGGPYRGRREGALGPSLENAALMFAHGNATAATAALVHALDTAERSQPMVWMCLFDLYARGGRQASLKSFALRFVVQFERSAPAWDEMAVGSNAASKPTATAAVRAKPSHCYAAT